MALFWLGVWHFITWQFGVKTMEILYQLEKVDTEKIFQLNIFSKVDNRDIFVRFDFPKVDIHNNNSNVYGDGETLPGVCRYWHVSGEQV